VLQTTAKVASQVKSNEPEGNVSIEQYSPIAGFNGLGDSDIQKEV
jgi:hypothetical protein